MTVLVWRWRTCADPNRPTPAQCKALGIPPVPNIPHPLASRFGERCTLIAQGRNGNRLVEFEDGFRTVAPLYATRAARTGAHSGAHNPEGQRLRAMGQDSLF